MLAPTSLSRTFSSSCQLTISVHGHSEHVIDKPITPNEIKEILYTKLYPHDIFHVRGRGEGRRGLVDFWLEGSMCGL